MKFKIGDRVIVNGRSGTIVADDDGHAHRYLIKFDDNLKMTIRYWHEDIQLDIARIRDEKLNKLI